MVLFMLPSNVLCKNKLYMVVVGVADYPGDNMDLNLPDNDAITISAIFKHNGKNTGNTERALLVNKRATASSIIATMENLYANASTDDIIALFFSGHGCEEGFCAYDRILDFDTIKSTMSKFNCTTKIIFADACFSGMIREKNGIQKININNIQNKFSKNGESVVLFMSSRSYEYSYENQNMKNGYFTNALKYGLIGKADINKDRKITAIELFNYVNKDVANKTEGMQHPTMWGNFNNNMPIIIW